MNKISVRYIGNNGYIFNAKDYLEIRNNHRIVGNLIGCSIPYPRNSNKKGLPAILSIFELQLLYELEIINILNVDKLKECPSNEEKKCYEDACVEILAQQKQYSKELKLNNCKKNMKNIIAGKRKKLLKSGGSVTAVQTELIKLNENDILKEISDSYVFDDDNMKLIQIPTQYPFNSVCGGGGGDGGGGGVGGVESSECVALPKLDTLKYLVFKDFWHKGKYITCGDSFGGDFLIYPGDPKFYHASHIVHCVTTQNVCNPEPTIKMHMLIACSRLSVAVNKLCLFAYLNGNNELCYQTLEWEGNTRYET